MLDVVSVYHPFDFPDGSDGKESACNAGDLDLITGLGRFPGEVHGHPLCIPAWRLLWTEEPDGLQSMGSQRIGHDRSNLAHTCH